MSTLFSSVKKYRYGEIFKRGWSNVAADEKGFCDCGITVTHA